MAFILEKSANIQYLTRYLTWGQVTRPQSITFTIGLQLNLGHRHLVFASTTNFKSGPRFAKICCTFKIEKQNSTFFAACVRQFNGQCGVRGQDLCRNEKSFQSEQDLVGRALHWKVGLPARRQMWTRFDLFNVWKFNLKHAWDLNTRLVQFVGPRTLLFQFSGIQTVLFLRLAKLLSVSTCLFHIFKVKNSLIFKLCVKTGCEVGKYGFYSERWYHTIHIFQ